MLGWLITNLTKIVIWHNSPSNNVAAIDYGWPAGDMYMRYMVDLAYDWFYSEGTNNAGIGGLHILRTNALAGANQSMLADLYIGRYSTDVDGGEGGGPGFVFTNQPTWNYPQHLGYVDGASMTKLGISHWQFMQFVNMSSDIAGYGAPSWQKSFDFRINYALARTAYLGGFAALHSGPYGYADQQMWPTTLGLQLLDIAMPEANVHRIPMAGFGQWYSYLLPHKMRALHGAYGDGGPSTSYGNIMAIGRVERGYDFATWTRSGEMWQAYLVNSNLVDLSGITYPYFINIPLRWYYRNMPTPVTNSTSRVWPEDGWVVASEISTSLPQCYTQGVYFSMHARPRGNTAGHDIYSDGSYFMSAYGCNLTAGGGAGLDAYGYRPDASPGLFVGGYGYGDWIAGGIGTYLRSPLLPVIARISNFTNSSTNLVYTAADLSGCFTNVAHPLSNVITTVKRHVLFPRSKYWVIYDEFIFSSNCIAMVREHVPWNFRYRSGGSAIGSEIEMPTGGAYGSSTFISNSTVRLTNGFQFKASNFTDAQSAGYAIPPEIDVYHIVVNDTNTWGMFIATGTNFLTTGTNQNAIGSIFTNSTTNPFRNGGVSVASFAPDRAAGIWITNKTAGTNFVFCRVIVPVEPGVDAPVVTRVNDFTVTVEYDGVTETITAGDDYEPDVTYRLNTLASFSGGGGDSETPFVRSNRLQAGRAVIGVRR